MHLIHIILLHGFDNQVKQEFWLGKTMLERK